MNGFELFDPSAWSDDGVTVSSPKETPTQSSISAGLRRHALAWIITAVGAVTAHMDVPSGPSQSAFRTSHNGERPAQVVSRLEVAPGYWPALIADMQTWSPVSGPVEPYPDPLV